MDATNIISRHVIYRKRYYFRVLASTHNRRCKLGKRLSGYDLWKLYKKQRGKCVLTGKKLNKGNISLDHIVSVYTGGTNDLDNLRFIDIKVNVMKNILGDAEFLSLCEEVINYTKK